MSEINRFERYKSFYQSLEEKSLITVFIYIVISFFIYVVFWIYDLSKKLQIVDEDAPEPNRALVIMCVLPFIWVIIHFLLEDVIFGHNEHLLESIEQPIEFFVLLILSLLTIKFFMDFSKSFAKVTFTNNVLWTLLIVPGFIGVILLGFEIYYAAVLVIFPIISILIMQNELNKNIGSFNFKNKAVSMNKKYDERVN